jgi:long-subunit fatty acid transport protein
MKRVYVLIFVMTFVVFSVTKSQTVAAKSNVLYDATSTINLGLEFALSPRWTLELPVNYNPWDFGENRKVKHWLIQPEVRHWLCGKFNGQFIGFHGHVGGYNMGGIKLIGLEKHRYEGNLYGAGFSYGYHWILNTRLSIEATIGLGYALLDYTKYKCEKCAEKIKDNTKNYFGPTKAGISLIYIIK